MVLGEGAAVLALENLDLARERGAPVLAEIIGYGISTDNFHITQPEPSGIGARQAMERALESAHVSAADVDYINAHGPPRSSTMQPRARQSAHCLMVCR